MIHTKVSDPRQEKNTRDSYILFLPPIPRVRDRYGKDYLRLIVASVDNCGGVSSYPTKNVLLKSTACDRNGLCITLVTATELNRAGDELSASDSYVGISEAITI